MYRVALVSTNERKTLKEFTDVEDYYYNESTDVLILYNADGITRAMIKSSAPEYYTTITKP